MNTKLECSFSKTCCQTQVKVFRRHYYLHIAGRKNTFSKGISGMWNVNSLDQDLNSSFWVHFQQWWPLHHYLYVIICCNPAVICLILSKLKHIFRVLQFYYTPVYIGMQMQYWLKLGGGDTKNYWNIEFNYKPEQVLKNCHRSQVKWSSLLKTCHLPFNQHIYQCVSDMQEILL